MTPYLPAWAEQLTRKAWTPQASLMVDRALLQAETRYQLEWKGLSSSDEYLNHGHTMRPDRYHGHDYGNGGAS